jgi:pimeloyl-ACP methyl ester carboxylesterase
MAMKVVLLPGLHGTGDLFEDFVDALPDGLAAQVVGYPKDVSLSYPELLELVKGVAPASEPFVVVAESFSTPLAIQFAAGNPESLKGVVLAAGFATCPVRGLLRFLAPILSPVLGHLPVSEVAARIAVPRGRVPHPLQDRMRGAIVSVRPRVLMDRVRAVVACNVLEELCGIRVPVLYLQSKQDRIVDPVCLDEMRHAKPEMEVVVLDGSHILLQTMPEQTAGIVADFVRRL